VQGLRHRNLGVQGGDDLGEEAVEDLVGAGPAGLIGAYVAGGGAPETALPRGGVPAASWAPGWHRLWAIERYLDPATTWINDPSQDGIAGPVVRRHLKEAAECRALT
jgi:hypothetical protein